MVKIIETRVIQAVIELQWDDLRSEAERQGLWILSIMDTPEGKDLVAEETLNITSHEYKGNAVVYYDENGEINGIGYIKDPENISHSDKYVNIIEMAFLRKFIIKKLEFTKITGARINWHEKIQTEGNRFRLRDLGKVYIGSMNTWNDKWYRLWGIKHEFVGEMLTNALSDFHFLSN